MYIKGLGKENLDVVSDGDNNLVKTIELAVMMGRWLLYKTNTQELEGIL